MPDLEMLLRDVRPAPDPAWATRLDSRVAARFPGPPPRWKAPLIALRDHLIALGAVTTMAVAVIALVTSGALHGGSGDDSASSGSAKSSPAVEETSSDKSANSSSGAGGAAPQREANSAPA